MSHSCWVIIRREKINLRKEGNVLEQARNDLSPPSKGRQQLTAEKLRGREAGRGRDRKEGSDINYCEKEGGNWFADSAVSFAHTQISNERENRNCQNIYFVLYGKL